MGVGVDVDVVVGLGAGVKCRYYILRLLEVLDIGCDGGILTRCNGLCFESKLLNEVTRILFYKVR